MSNHRIATVTVAVIFGFLASCGHRSGGPDYRIETLGSPLTAGTEGQVSVRFLPREGYHWNEEFPARLRVQEAHGVKPLRETFSSADRDFRSLEGAGVLEMPVLPAQAGEGRVRALADFSLCNAQECRVFKQVPVEIPVQVQ